MCFWQCARSVLILLHRPFAKTFVVIRGVVKLGEPLATFLFAASAAYLACVVEDTNSCVYDMIRHLAIHRKTHRSTGVLGLATRGAVLWCTGA